MFFAIFAVKSFSFSFWEYPRIFLLCATIARHAPITVFLSIQRMSQVDITSQIIGAAIKVHRRLGPGLLESAYEACLAYELEQLGFRVQRQKAVSLVYRTVRLECGFRADMVVEGRVVVEVKCKDALHPVDQAQILSYLRLLDIQIGLLINFHVILLKDGIKRVVNNYRELPEEEEVVIGQTLNREGCEEDPPRTLTIVENPVFMAQPLAADSTIEAQHSDAPTSG